MTVGAAILLHALAIIGWTVAGLIALAGLVALVWVMAIALMWAANPTKPKTTLDLLAEDLDRLDRHEKRADLSRLDRLDGLGGDR